MYDDVLIPTDGSEGFGNVADHGIDLADSFGARVHGLFVVDTTEATTVPEPEWTRLETTLKEAGKRNVADVADRARERDVDVTTELRRGTPHREILNYVDENDVDLVVMGTHARSGIERLVLGSVTAEVVRRSPVPVLLEQIGGAGEA